MGIIFVAIILATQSSKQKYALIGAAVGLWLIWFVVGQLEEIYKAKSWYGPRMSPPDGYIRGPLSMDQGNNI